MQQYYRELQSFLKERRWELCLTGFLLVLSLYRFLFSDNYRMDTIIKQVSRGDEFNDMELGRFGIVLLNRFFGMRIHNPYLSAFLTVTVILLSSAFLSFVLWKATGGRSGIAGCLVPLAVYLTPNWIEQMYFSYQIFLVILGVLLLEAAVFLTEFGEGKRSLLLPFLLCFIAFAIYQAFVPLYLTLCIGLVLLRCMDVDRWRKVRPGRSALRHAGVFFAGIGAYFLVNGIIQRGYAGTGYLNSQLRWGTEPIPGVVRSIIMALQSVITGSGRIDTLSYSVSALCCLILLVLRLPKDPDRTHRILLIFGWLAFQLTAFAMLLLLGVRSFIRTELSVTFVMGINLLFAFLLAKQQCGEHRLLNRFSVGIVSAAALVCLYSSAAICFRLMYTDDVRYAYDVRLAAQVIARLQKTGARSGEKPVVFVGEPDVKLDESCLMGEVIGRSLFQFETDEDVTNTLISHFLTTQGFRYPEPESGFLLDGGHLAEEMPSFPEEGSVLETDQFVVVKFSKDYYYDLQVLEPSAELSDLQVVYGNGTLCQLENISTDGYMVRIQGFNLLRGTDSRNIGNSVYLLNRNDGSLYRLSTACRQRALLTRMYWRDEVSYDTAGFTALFPNYLLERAPDTVFEILVRYELDGDAYFVSTGEFISKRIADRMPAVIREAGYKKR